MRKSELCRGVKGDLAKKGKTQKTYVLTLSSVSSA